MWREECRQSDHVFDAVLCAYSGYLRERDDWQISRLAADQIEPQGWIWVPPSPVVPADNRSAARDAAVSGGKKGE